MAKLTNAELLVAIAARLEKIARPEPVVHGYVDFSYVPGTSIGNRDPRTQIFSRRSDIEPHAHRPGNYFCGKCMVEVVV